MSVSTANKPPAPDLMVKRSISLVTCSGGTNRGKTRFRPDEAMEKHQYFFRLGYKNGSAIAPGLMKFPGIFRLPTPPTGC